MSVSSSLSGGNLTSQRVSAPTLAKRKQEQGGKFKVLIGVHLAPGPQGCVCDNCLSTPPKDHVYEAYDSYVQRCRGRDKVQPLPQDEYTNDLIDSQQDLELRCNAGPFSRKFERVRLYADQQAAQGQPQPPAAYPIEKMTYPQLLGYAAEEEIDLKQASKKEEVLRIIREVQALRAKSNPAPAMPSQSK